MHTSTFYHFFTIALLYKFLFQRFEMKKLIGISGLLALIKPFALKPSPKLLFSFDNLYLNHIGNFRLALNVVLRFCKSRANTWCYSWYSLIYYFAFIEELLSLTILSFLQFIEGIWWMNIIKLWLESLPDECFLNIFLTTWFFCASVGSHNSQWAYNLWLQFFN